VSSCSSVRAQRVPSQGCVGRLICRRMSLLGFPITVRPFGRTDARQIIDTLDACNRSGVQSSVRLPCSGRCNISRAGCPCRPCSCRPDARTCSCLPWRISWSESTSPPTGVQLIPNLNQYLNAPRHAADPRSADTSRRRTSTQGVGPRHKSGRAGTARAASPARL